MCLLVFFVVGGGVERGHPTKDSRTLQELRQVFQVLKVQSWLLVFFMNSAAVAHSRVLESLLE